MSDVRARETNAVEIAWGRMVKIRSFMTRVMLAAGLVLTTVSLQYRQFSSLWFLFAGLFLTSGIIIMVLNWLIG